jgi:hypothetical protein
VSSGSLSSASDSYSASSELQDNEATHYADFDARKEKGWVQRHVQGVTPSGVRKQILRKTVRWVAPSLRLSRRYCIFADPAQAQHMDLCRRHAAEHVRGNQAYRGVPAFVMYVSLVSS